MGPTSQDQQICQSKSVLKMLNNRSRWPVGHWATRLVRRSNSGPWYRPRAVGESGTGPGCACAWNRFCQNGIKFAAGWSFAAHIVISEFSWSDKVCVLDWAPRGPPRGRRSWAWWRAFKFENFHSKWSCWVKNSMSFKKSSSVYYCQLFIVIIVTAQSHV